MHNIELVLVFLTIAVSIANLILLFNIKNGIRQLRQTVKQLFDR